jgi:hypothetical protein
MGGKLPDFLLVRLVVGFHLFFSQSWSDHLFFSCESLEGGLVPGVGRNDRLFVTAGRAHVLTMGAADFLEPAPAATPVRLPENAGLAGIDEIKYRVVVDPDDVVVDHVRDFAGFTVPVDAGWLFLFPVLAVALGVLLFVVRSLESSPRWEPALCARDVMFACHVLDVFLLLLLGPKRVPGISHYDPCVIPRDQLISIRTSENLETLQSRKHQILALKTSLTSNSQQFIPENIPGGNRPSIHAFSDFQRIQ